MINTSTIPGAGPEVRSFEKTTVVAAPPEDAWVAWTTAEQLTAWWTVPNVNIELRVGGPFELLFDSSQEPGKQGSEGCVFLGYVPNEMLSFTWNAPPHLSLREQNTWVVITFEPIDGGTTVRLIHTGFLTGPDWDAYMDYFRGAWSIVLDRLTEHFA